MLGKLALRNIRRSVRDYAIYFVTLLIAITVFYAFNSISDQQVMKEISESGRMNIIEFTNIMMSLFSGVIALVLGFLVIYANQLLIRRRKREFGMYFMLGMSAGQVSRVVLYETVFVGLISLILGLGLGILVSQLLSFATAALFGVPLPNYEFSFSMTAFIMTLVCFLVIYVVVAIFNVFSIRRCKLIDLINADSTSQKIAIRNPWLCLILFMVSIVILAVAYWHLQQNGMVFVADEDFNIATACMLIGTLLLFFSLSGFLIAVITNAKRFYLRKLRPFTTRQIASKVNTSFASMWIVSVLLFMAITTFSTGMALIDAFVKDIDAANPYDASVLSFHDPHDESPFDLGDPNFDVRTTEAFLEEHIANWDSIVQESARLDVYRLPIATYGDVLDATGVEIQSSSGYVNKQGIAAMGLSQFNRMLEMQGKKPVSMSSHEYLITNNVEVTEELAQEMVKQSYPLNTPVGTLTPVKEVMAVQLSNGSMLDTTCNIVVPDEVIEATVTVDDAMYSHLNIQYDPGYDGEEDLYESIYATHVPGLTNVLVRTDMIAQSMGMRMLITYLALYIGLVLLVSVAAVLAIQLLSLTIDSLKRYRGLSRIGCDKRMLSRSLFAQVLTYFLLPLVVALCHSGWTIHVMCQTLFDGFGLDILPPILATGAFVLVIYGGYLLITFFASRMTVMQGLRESA